MFVAHLAVTSVTVSRWVAVRDEVFVCLQKINDHGTSIVSDWREQWELRAPVMSVFRIPAGTYLTDVSSTPVIGPVTRGLLSPLVYLSYWTWRNPHWLNLIKISLWTKWLQRRTLGEYLRVDRFIVQTTLKLGSVKIVENEFWIRTRAGLNTKNLHKMCNVWLIRDCESGKHAAAV